MAVKRIFLIVLDSVGIGNAPDSESFGDLGANTVKTVSSSPEFCVPNLIKLGLSEIDGVDYLRGEKISTESKISNKSVVCRLTELSKGKDTTIGHWEIAGLVSERPLPVYPNGFPKDVIEAFENATGRKVICNKPYSGTEVIKDYGREHIETGSLIVYTSADSVFQIAAHEDVVPVEALYEYCKIARNLLVGEHGVGRVIARPFTGEHPFTRTSRRHDFSIDPPRRTVLEAIKESGRACIAVGKINDIFVGKGITEFVHTSGNADGMKKTLEYAEKSFEGLCFVNLVDFDMNYGHRNDVDGYARALSEFDRWLPELLSALSEDDVLMITADHGCDPGFKGTDHTRECVPFIMVSGKKSAGEGGNVINLGTRKAFADIANTIADIWKLDFKPSGEDSEGDSMLPSVLGNMAVKAMENAYAPYSEFKVGAALLSSSGNIYTGCNVENASFGATVCAERNAVCKAVSHGEKNFTAIAVAGGRKGIITGKCSPCGICRQTLSEFCDPKEFKIIEIFDTKGNEYEIHTLEELLPSGFKGF